MQTLHKLVGQNYHYNKYDDIHCLPPKLLNIILHRIHGNMEDVNFISALQLC